LNRTQLQTPPHPASYPSTQSWQMAMYQTMLNWKQRIETDSTVNTTPVGPVVIGTFTPTTTITGTDEVSNFVATLVNGMQQQGITSPNTQRNTT
jgi:hypothetical protein